MVLDEWNGSTNIGLAYIIILRGMDQVGRQAVTAFCIS